MPTRIERTGQRTELVYTPAGYTKAMTIIFGVIAVLGLLVALGSAIAGHGFEAIFGAALEGLVAGAAAWAFSRGWRVSTLRIDGGRVHLAVRFRWGGSGRRECALDEVTGIRVTGSINWAHVVLDTTWGPMQISTVGRSAAGKRVLKDILEALGAATGRVPEVPEGLRRWWKV